MEVETRKSVFEGNDGIYSSNRDEWYKVFRSYANVCDKLYHTSKYHECIKVGRDAIEIYTALTEQLKKDKVLKGNDLTIAECRFKDECHPEKFSNNQYKELSDIKKVCKFVGVSYRCLAEDAYVKKDYLAALNFSKNAVVYGPKEVLVNFTLAKTLAQLKASKEAADSYETVMVYDKNYNEGRRLLAELYKTDDLMELDKAVWNYSEYLKTAKNDKWSWLNYAGQCYKLGLQKECMEACETIFKIDPTLYNAIIVYMLNLLKIDGYEQKQIKDITEKVVKRYIKAANVKENAFNFNSRSKDPDRKLKIGYLSSDLYNHVVSRFLMPVIKNHNKERFDIYMYTVTDKHDSVSKQYEEVCKSFLHCNKMSNDELAKKIYEDEIDILVDLNVHTGDARTIVMAQKPAPVQAIYLGYPNTSGIKTVDYILTDKNTIFEGEEDLYTEKPAYIGAGYEVISMDAAGLPDITPAPYIKNKYITMGVFNAAAKVTPEMIGIWSQILKRAKNVKILFQYIYYYTKKNQERILKEFAKHGIKKDRVIFMGKAEGVHYNSIALADFALDTFPYSGTGTTMDSILMGLPIICIEGYHATSRPTGRILKQLGRTELIASDFNGYIENALKLINNPSLISNYRKTLRDELKASPLADYTGFTRSLENTYKRMWKEYCSPNTENAATLNVK